MNAPAFRLATRPPVDVPVARPMDGLAIGALSPQEDEFALLSLGADSAYRGFLMPHRLQQLGHTLDPAFWLANPDWLKPWEAFLAGVLRGDSGQQPLILKSPNHTFRAPALLRRFPRARFVWMARAPEEVLQSNRKMWGAMFKAHGLTASDGESLDQFLALALQESAKVLQSLAQLPSSQLVVCPHQALQEAPGDVLRAISTRLSLPANADTSALERAMAGTRSGRIEHYAGTLPEQLQPALNALREAQRRALASHGV